MRRFVLTSYEYLILYMKKACIYAGFSFLVGRAGFEPAKT